jgi:hypothetical protein
MPIKEKILLVSISDLKMLRIWCARKSIAGNMVPCIPTIEKDI